MQVFLDCDGVLADFDKAGELLWGMPPREYEKKVGTDQFWKELQETTDFYANLPVMLGADTLVAECQDITGHLPIILTGCPRGEWAESQKLAWGNKWFPYLEMITTKSRFKCNHGKPGDVLIDDWPRYRHYWVQMGGVFILHRSVEQSLERLKKVLNETKV